MSAYEAGADAKADVGTFRVADGSATLSKSTTNALERAAKDLGISITYGGKGGVTVGGVRRGYTNGLGNVHIYEDAKIMLPNGVTVSGTEAATRIIAGHELITKDSLIK